MVASGNGDYCRELLGSGRDCGKAEPYVPRTRVASISCGDDYHVRKTVGYIAYNVL